MYRHEPICKQAAQRTIFFLGLEPYKRNNRRIFFGTGRTFECSYLLQLEFNPRSGIIPVQIREEYLWIILHREHNAF